MLKLIENIRLCFSGSLAHDMYDDISLSCPWVSEDLPGK